MIESRVRALFTEIADGEPATSRVDTQLARRRGRARLRWRRACAVGTPVLAAAAFVVVALAAAAAPSRPAPGPAAGPAAPRQFSPLVPYVSFGWLPAGNKLVDGDVQRTVVSADAARKLDAVSNWSLSVYAAGQCHLTTRPRGLKCSTAALEGLRAQLNGRAPIVRGHRAFWAGPYLVWQYARGGWASLYVPFPEVPYHGPKRLPSIEREAVKIASHVRYGAATPPLVFPVQLTRLPRQWRVSSVYYLPDAGVLRARSWALGAGPPNLGADGGLVYQTNLPYFSYVDPATSGRGACSGGTHEIINGYRVILIHRFAGTKFSRHDLCAAHAGGLSLYISQFGAHPSIDLASLFRDHVRLLGANPANWTRRPIG
jgi:hypothetical protein